MPDNEDLFRNAIELSGADREQFLNALTDSQRADVDRMMNAAAEAANRMGTPSPSLPEIDSVPDQIGPYRVLERIGEGGMGQVFIAEQLRPVKRRVALKVIRTDMPSKQILARFEAERQALAMMDHQNIAKVLDAGITDDGRPYFAMELVKGVPITEYCDTNKLTPTERLELFVQACRAIQHAHQKGIIHRDIKPSNVLATLYDGRPTTKVIDFGLAKALHDHAKLTDRTLYTQHGQIVGTLEYMSPEQAERNALDVDTRTDVFSLGVILYELMTGSTPIGRERLRSETMDRILLAIREEDAPRMSTRLSQSGDAISGISERRKTEPRRLSQLVKGDLQWIAAKALEKDRTRRYDGAGELADDIGRYLNNEPIEARPPSLGYRLQKAYRRNRGSFIVAASIVTLLIAGLIGTGTMWGKAVSAKSDAIKAQGRERDARLEVERERDKVAAERDRARVAEKRALAAGNELEATLSRSNYTLAVARWEANRPGEALQYLDLIPPDQRGFPWRLARREFGGSDVTCYGHQTPLNDVAISPDGKLVASVGRERAIRLWNHTSGEEVKVLQGHESDITSIAFSPNGEQLVTASVDRTIILWHIPSGKAVRTLTGHENVINCVAFGPDGKTVVSGSHDKTARLWEVESGKEIRRFTVANRHISDACISPDGGTLATSGWDFAVRLWDIETGEERHVLHGHGGFAASVAFHPNGTQVVSGSWDHTLKVWDVKTGRELQTLKGHSNYVDCVDFSPDGRRVVSGSGDRTVKVWDIATGEVIRTFKGHNEPVQGVCFNPDGSRVVSASDDLTVKFWSMDSDTNERTLRPLSGGICSAEVSPDSELIAIGSRNGEISLWDSVTGERVRRLMGHNGRINCLAFTPNGKRLISGGEDESIRVWDRETGRQIAVLRGHTDSVFCLAVGPAGGRVVSGGRDKTIRVWNIASGDEILSIAAPDVVRDLALSPDGRLIASSAMDSGKVQLWNASTGAKVAALGQADAFESSITFSPDGRLLATGGFGRCVRIWDVASRAQLAVLSGHTSGLQSVCFSHDSSHIASGADDGSVRIWDVASRSELRAIQSHETRIVDVRFSPDGSFLASACVDGLFKIWDAPIATEYTMLKGHTMPVVAATVSPNGALAASGGVDRTVRLWNPKTGSCLNVLKGHTDFVHTLSFSPDSSQVGSASNKEEFVWDAKTGERIPGDRPPRWLRRRLAESVGRWRAIPVGNAVRLVDCEFRDTERESAYRAFKSRPRPQSHERQSVLAQRAKDWFATAVQSAWHMNYQPDSRSAYDALHRAHDFLRMRQADQNLPTIVTQSLSLAAPPLTAREADRINRTVWNIAGTNALRPTLHLIGQMEEACEQHRVPAYFNTLGTAYYRDQQFEKAIAACGKAINNGSESPFDFAIIAMSHWKLGNADAASEFRQKFDAAVSELGERKTDEVERYVAEVARLFGKEDGTEPLP